MFFQISVTPTKQENAKQTKIENKNRHYQLILAPFQPQTCIELESFINKSVECFLDVKSTNDKDIDISITKIPSKDRNIELNMSTMSIQSNGSVTMHIKWTPKKPGAYRDILQFTDNRKIKYDVVIVTLAKGLINENAQRKTKLVKSASEKVSARNVPIVNKLSYNNRHAKRSSSIQQISNVETKRTRLAMNSEIEQNKENFSLTCNNRIITNNLEQTDICNNVSLQSGTLHNKVDPSTHICIVPDRNILLPHVPICANNSVPKQLNLQTPVSDVSPQTLLRRTTIVKGPKYAECTLFQCKDETEIFGDSLVSNANQANHLEFSVLDQLEFKPADIFLTPMTEYCYTPCAKFTDNYSEDKILSTTVNELHENLPNELNISNLLTISPFQLRNISSQTKELSSKIDFSPVIPADKYFPQLPYLTSSSPINGTLNAPGSSSFKHSVVNKSLTYTESLSVKEVLEADLWVKPKTFNQWDTFMSNSRSNLETILDEKSTSEEEETLKINKTHTLSKSMKMSAAVCIEISPPTKSMHSRKVSPKKSKTIIRGTSGCEAGNLKKKLYSSVSMKRNTNVTVPNIKINRFSVTNLAERKNKYLSEEARSECDMKFKFYKLESGLTSETEDPFLSSTLYYEKKWLYNQEIIFKKWLNTLLTPPEDLTTDIETASIDVAQIWQICKLKEDTILAETKEAISARYHTDTRLNTLRKAACAMFHKPNVANVISRITACIEKGILTVRLDRDLQRDIGLQKTILELFLSYNPLWLRIGLETIYGETISLKSNNDLVGLTRFLLKRFFSDPTLTKKQTHAYYNNQQYRSLILQVNKLMLRKFLILTYFLDYAKSHKLIGHDPCLFHKRAVNKNSRSILLTFSREVLSGIGDITKVLRAYDYSVSHKQTFIDEFDYAVRDICTDLRDGVRLCKVMELITGCQNLARHCRVPAISRLQKIHNVDTALKALLQSNFTLLGGIDAKSIVDGHREKILSLLWQIIYKYQAPRFEKAALCIQKWWRAQLWYIHTKNYIRLRKHNAACTIQRAWRQYLAKCIALKQIEKCNYNKKLMEITQPYKLHRACNTYDRQRFVQLKSAAIQIQKWWRRLRETRLYVQNMRKMYHAVLAIQRHWRATLFMQNQRSSYMKLRQATYTIQLYWRGMQSMRQLRSTYVKLKMATIIIQRRWRALQAMKETHAQYIRLKRASISIQSRWRSKRQMHVQQRLYIQLRTAAIMIQRAWQKRQMKRNIISYLAVRRKSAIMIQSYWRMYREVKMTASKQQAVRKIQSYWRAYKVGKVHRNYYLSLRLSAIRIQQWYKSILSCRKIIQEYNTLKRVVIRIQRKWRSKQKIRKEIFELNLKSSAANKIQGWWRNTVTRKKYELMYHKSCWDQRQNMSWFVIHKDYQNYVQAAVQVQRWWRKIYALKKEENRRVHAIGVIKHWWKKMRRLRQFSQAAICIQSVWRGYRLRKSQSELVTQLRRRCAAATKAALPTETLRHRWERSLRIIGNYNCSIGQLSLCIRALDVITILSPKECITLCELNLVGKMYEILQQSNRSLPWTEVCVSATSILITLAKFSPTKHYVNQIEYTTIIMSLWNAFWYNDELSLRLATLMWLLIQDEKYIEGIITRSDLMWLVRTVHDKTIKKKGKMALERTKGQINLLPSCKPDWGLKQKQPRIFTDLSFAVTIILQQIMLHEASLKPIYYSNKSEM